MSNITGLNDGDAFTLIDEIAALQDELNEARTMADLSGDQSEVIRIETEIRNKTTRLSLVNSRGGAPVDTAVLTGSPSNSVTDSWTYG